MRAHLSSYILSKCSPKHPPRSFSKDNERKLREIASICQLDYIVSVHPFAPSQPFHRFSFPIPSCMLARFIRIAKVLTSECPLWAQRPSSCCDPRESPASLHSLPPRSRVDKNPSKNSSNLRFSQHFGIQNQRQYRLVDH